MTDNNFNFCPKCGKKNIHYKNGKKWLCDDCGFDLYNNVASAVGVIISDKENSVLFEVRAKEPRKGFLALPGGFCDYDETAENAAVRECIEEIGIAPSKIRYLCSFPNDYEYKNIAYKTCDLFFTAELSEKEGSLEELLKKLKFQESEVVSAKICKISSKEDLEKIPLAFKSAKNALTIWLSAHKIN